MRSIWLAIIMLFMFIPTVAAADKLENYNQAAESEQSAQISWRLTGLGKLSGDMILAPNGNILLPLGNKIVCVDLNGKVLWESSASSSGTMGQPIIGGNNSIYSANASSVQEIKLNGTSVWNFSVYSGAKSAKVPLLAGGFDNRLYLPLPNAIYSVNLTGHYMWMLSTWDSSEAYMTKPITTREFLACTADKQAFYVVVGEKKAGYRLAAISTQGKFLWTYWLGDITKADLLLGENGEIFAVVCLNKSSSGSTATGGALKTGKIYSFKDKNGSSPVWQQRLTTTTELSRLTQYEGKTLYLTGGSKIYALIADDGSIIWEEPLLNLVSPPAIDPKTERIYAGSSDGLLFAVDQSGRVVWERTLDGSINRAPLIGPDGFLYVFTEKGSLYKIRDKI